jgi:hypothetical protein
MTHESTAPVTRPGTRASAKARSPLPVPALAIAALGGLLTVAATFLTWVTATVVVGDQRVLDEALRGTDGELHGTKTLALAVVALAVTALLLRARTSRAWVLLPVLGALILLLGWASTVKVANTAEQAAQLTSGLGSTVDTQVANGPGLWLAVLGGVLLLATAVLVPVLRRAAR